MNRVKEKMLNRTTGISCQHKPSVSSKTATAGISCQDNPSVIGRASTAGITLVALVVTIVVLLILAGITLTYVLGDHGIIKLAQEAKNKTEDAIANESNEWKELVGLLENRELIIEVGEENLRGEFEKVNTDGQFEVYRDAECTQKVIEEFTVKAGHYALNITLDAGVYYLKMTKAPEGYNWIAPMPFEIKGIQKEICKVILKKGEELLPTGGNECYVTEALGDAPNAECSFKCTVADERFSEAMISIYKVADVTLKENRSSCEFTFVGEYQDDRFVGGFSWSDSSLALSLQSFVVASNIPPIATIKGGGSVNHLAQGGYLVIVSDVVAGEFVFKGDPFLVATVQRKEEVWSNMGSIELFLKPVLEVKSETTSTIAVSIEWDDAGYEALRPTQLTLNMYRDGEVWEGWDLNSVNNWRHHWEGVSNEFSWIPYVEDISGYSYRVKASDDRQSFVITLKYQVPDPTTPLET